MVSQGEDSGLTSEPRTLTPDDAPAPPAEPAAEPAPPEVEASTEDASAGEASALPVALAESPVRPAETLYDSVRLVAEFLACVTICILLCTTWIIEPFIVPSSSMAEALQGPHIDVVCAECRFRYCLGSSADDRHAVARCPNCDALSPSLAEEQRVQGDRLLVSKQGFRWTAPRRWDVAVFRRSGHASQAYVKRLVGLPGEAVQVVLGEIVVNGTMVRKNLDEQRRLGVLLHDSAYPARDVGSPWRAARHDRHWEFNGSGYRRPASPDDPLPTDIRRLSLVDWLDYTSLRRLPGIETEQREEPIREHDPYNQLQFVRRNEILNEVVDLRIEAVVAAAGPGQLFLRASSEDDDFLARIEPELGRVELFHNGIAVRTRDLPKPLLARPTRVTWSSTDRQMLLAFDDEPVFPPYELPPYTRPAVAALSPLGLGASRLQVDLTHLKVYRDVYYTDPSLSPDSPPKHWGLRTPYRLGPDEYFGLGDNTSYSDDSRTWQEGPTISARLLIGRALIVHLPSTGAVWGGRWFQVPDLPRIRYIR